MKVIETLEFISKVKGIAEKYEYNINDFENWVEEGIIFTSYKDDSIKYIYHMKNKKWTLAISGSSDGEGGYYDYEVNIDFGLFNSINSLLRVFDCTVYEVIIKSCIRCVILIYENLFLYFTWPISYDSKIGIPSFF